MFFIIEALRRGQCRWSPRAFGPTPRGKAFDAEQAFPEAALSKSLEDIQVFGTHHVPVVLGRPPAALF